MSNPYSIDRDLKELAKMSDTIGRYVLSDDLYLSVGGMFGNFPQMTFGAVLLRIRRLNHFRSELSSVQSATLDKAIAQYDEVRSEWTVHYEKKMNSEVVSRLKSMDEFFRECQESARACQSGYPVEALRRTIVQEVIIALKADALDTHAAITACHRIDSPLRRWVIPGDFIWAESLAPVYPRDTFWWLYGQPDGTES